MKRRIKMKFEKTVSAKEALDNSKLNWEVAKIPMKITTPNGEKDTDQIAVVRTDSWDILGYHRQSYQPISNRQLAYLGESLVGETGAFFTGAGDFKSGKKVYFQVKLPGVIQTTKEDITEKFLLLASSFDGSLPLSVLFTPIRIVCQNSLTRALNSNDIKAVFKHTQNMLLRLDNVSEIIGIANQKAQMLEDLSKRLINVSVNQEMFKTLVKDSGVVPKVTDDDMSTRASNIMVTLSELFESGKGTELPGVRGTAWGAYNAVTEYVDHYQGSDDRRESNALFGRGAVIKETALEIVSKMV